jgi:hypothetical protein
VSSLDSLLKEPRGRLMNVLSEEVRKQG